MTTNQIQKGQIVKLKFGSEIGRAKYRGRCVGLFSIGTAGTNAEIVWFGDAVNELGNRGTFPASELEAA